MPTTTNFSWTTPVEDGSPGTWDTILNTLADDIDGDLNTVKTTADAALARAGGTMTGNLKLLTATGTVVNKGSMSGTVDLDLDNGNYFYGVKAGAITTLTFSNWTSGELEFLMWEVDNDAAGAITWPSEVEWDQDTAPTIDSADHQIFLFWSRDGGTTVYGKLVHQASVD